MKWLENESGTAFSLVAGNSDTLGSAEFNNGEQMWYAFDYTRPQAQRPGCAILGPFVSAVEAQAALEDSVRHY